MLNATKIKQSDALTIIQIAVRARDLYLNFGVHRPRIGLEMTVSAVHQQTPLRLADLLATDDLSFSREFSDIDANLDQVTGKLHRFFNSSFAVRTVPAIEYGFIQELAA